MINVYADPKIKEQFVFEVGSTKFVYQTTFRSQLLCQLFECICREVPSLFRNSGPFPASRLRKDGTIAECCLFISSFAVVETNPNQSVIQEYKWINVTKFCIDEEKRGIFFEASGRVKIFYCDAATEILTDSRYQVKQLGLQSEDIEFLTNQSILEAIDMRISIYRSIPSAVSVFDVSKKTRRYLRPIPRQLHISEDFILEKDSSGRFQLLFIASNFLQLESIWCQDFRVLLSIELRQFTPLSGFGVTRVTSALNSTTTPRGPTQVVREILCYLYYWTYVMRLGTCEWW